MSLPGLLNLTYTLWSMEKQTDAYGTPTRPAEPVQVESGRCAVMRKIMTGTQGAPAMGLERSVRVYLPVASQVRAGHVIEVHSIGKLTVAQPYLVRGHHYEVDGEWSDEA